MSLQPGTIGNIFAHYHMDLKPYNDCCNANGDVDEIHEDCSIYETHRPTVLGTYKASVTATAQFDPHFSTSDGLVYSYMGLGVYTYLLTNHSHPVNFQISTRKFGGGTMISGFALTYDVTKIECYRADSGETHFFINGEDLSAETMTPYTKLGVYLELLEKGMKLNIQELQLILNVYYVPGRNFIAIYTTLPESFLGMTKGLIGFYDGDSSNDFTAEGHSPLALF